LPPSCTGDVRAGPSGVPVCRRMTSTPRGGVASAVDESSSSDEDWKVVRHNLPEFAASVATKPRPMKLVMVTDPPSVPKPATAVAETSTSPVNQSREAGTQVLPRVLADGIAPPPYGVSIAEIVRAVRENNLLSAGEILQILVRRHGRFPRAVAQTLSGYILTAIAAECSLAQSVIGQVLERSATPEARHATMHSLSEMVHSVANRYVDLDALEACEPWPVLEEAVAVPDVVEIIEDSDVDAAEETDEHSTTEAEGEDDDPYQ